jgi:hypothetical protein
MVKEAIKIKDVRQLPAEQKPKDGPAGDKEWHGPLHLSPKGDPFGEK